MDHPVSPPVATPVPRRKGTVRKVFLVVFLVLSICFCVFVLFPLMVATISGVSVFPWVKDVAELNLKSYTDKFHLTILEVKSEPNYFMERIRVRCERDMETGIWVTDLKEVGLFKTNGTSREVFYYEGQPHKAGSSAPIHADGQYSTCEILFRVTTTSSNTVWHDEVAGGTLDTTLPSPLVVSAVQTNWPGAYERGSEIPLANLGDYKLLLSVK